MKRIALLVGAAILLVLMVVLWRFGATKNFEYRYVNRAVVYPTGPFRLLQKALPPVVVQTHDAVADQALMIRDAQVVEHPYFSCPTPQTCGHWSFAGVIRRAFQVGQVPQGTADSVLVSAIKHQMDSSFANVGMVLDPAWTSSRLEDAPVHLLAIVNRMDLAQVQPDGALKGAELRFAYEALDPNDSGDDYLRLIVEFVLPTMPPSAFQALAGCWMNLSNPPKNCNLPGTTYLDNLQSLVDGLTNQSTMVRMRADGLAAFVWEPREFLFQGASLAPNRLERQPKIKTGVCQDSTTPLGQFAAAQTQQILASNYEYDNWPTADNQPLVCTADILCLIGGAGGNVLVLGTDTGLGNQLDDVRFSLSVNSCTACHSSETSTQQVQIAHRLAGQTSQLSGFLTGQPQCQASASASGRASQADPIPYCTVSTHVGPNPAGKCAGATMGSRSFNDLLRRHMYIYTVQNMSPSASPADWLTALAQFTAYQVD